MNNKSLSTLAGVMLFLGSVFISTLCHAHKQGLFMELNKASNGDKYLVLCYHDVPNTLSNGDKYSTDFVSFVRQLEYLTTHGCHFIGLKDLERIEKNGGHLPERAVMLTFDDGYLSFSENILPILQVYGYPAVLGIVTIWPKHPPKKLPKATFVHHFMNWKQVERVAKSPLVDVITHTHNSHHGVVINPQGNTAPAMSSLQYFPKLHRYETKKEYIDRVSKDLTTSSMEIYKHLGYFPEAVVWPYGAYSGVCLDAARKAGLKIAFTLNDGYAKIGGNSEIPRYMLDKNPSIAEFAKTMKKIFKLPVRLRIIHADIDKVYDDDSAKMAKNIDKFVERMYRLKPDVVYLQAFRDVDGDGNVKEVYFPNSVLPMKADIFSRISRSLMIRGMEVYAWMPSLAVTLPDESVNKRIHVMERKNGEIKNSTSWYRRISPFSAEGLKIMERLYSDLALYAPFDGLLFQDDAYLNDFEDFSPEGLAVYAKIAGDPRTPFEKLSNDKKDEWTDRKTDALNDFTKKLAQKVLYYKPKAKFARTIYASTLTNTESEEWFAQNYEKCIAIYDYTVVMAYPRMEKKSNPRKWLRKLVEKVASFKKGLNRTVFKVQAYDWKRDEWIDSATVAGWLKNILAAGGHNIAYYPDNYKLNKPELKVICRMIGTEDFPLKQPNGRGGK